MLPQLNGQRQLACGLAFGCAYAGVVCALPQLGELCICVGAVRKQLSLLWVVFPLVPFSRAVVGLKAPQAAESSAAQRCSLGPYFFKVLIAPRPLQVASFYFGPRYFRRRTDAHYKAHGRPQSGCRFGCMGDTLGHTRAS